MLIFTLETLHCIFTKTNPILKKSGYEPVNKVVVGTILTVKEGSWTIKAVGFYSSSVPLIGPKKYSAILNTLICVIYR